MEWIIGLAGARAYRRRRNGAEWLKRVGDPVKRARTGRRRRERQGQPGDRGAGRRLSGRDHRIARERGADRHRSRQSDIVGAFRCADGRRRRRPGRSRRGCRPRPPLFRCSKPTRRGRARRHSPAGSPNSAGLDIATVKGGGRHGEIRRADVDDAIRARTAALPPSPSACRCGARLPPRLRWPSRPLSRGSA